MPRKAPFSLESSCAECRYEALFRDMAAALRASQLTAEFPGFWPPSLRAFALHPFPESSSTGFFVAGFAWGVRVGLLPEDDFLPAAEAGWAALRSAQQPDGRIGWAQQIGAGPDTVREGDTQLYAAGSFLQAATQMLRLARFRVLPRVAVSHRPAPILFAHPDMSVVTRFVLTPSTGRWPRLAPLSTPCAHSSQP